MKTIARGNGRHPILPLSAVLVAALLLAVRLTAASVIAAAAPESEIRAAPAATSQPVGPKAYVALSNYSEVAVVDPLAHQVLAYIPALLSAHDLVASPNGRAVYVATDGVPTVSVIDTSKDVVVAAIPMETNPSGLSVSPDGRELLVSLSSTDEVVSIDTASNRITGRVAVPWPGRSAISPDGRRAYVISTGSGSPVLTILDLRAHTRIGGVPLNAVPVALNFGSGGKRLYLTMANMQTILALDTVSNSVAARIAVPAGPRNPVPTDDGRSILVVSRDTRSLDFVDLATGVVLGAVTVGMAPTWVAVGHGDHVAYVTNEGSDDVSVVNLDTRSLVTNITVGYGPTEIVLVQPGT